jgi:hypothetical protein
MEVLADVDPDLAAHKLTEMNADLVIAGLSQHVRVLDISVMTGIHEPDDAHSGEVGGYRLIAKHSDSWDAIVSILISLAAEHTDHFQRLMRGCRALSHTGFEEDVLNLPGAEEQSAFDLFIDREGRREKQGYVAPEQARAFLESARSCGIPKVTQSSSTEALQVAGAALQTMRSQMQFVFEHDSVVYRKRSEELSHLANTLISGCPVQGRAFTTHEASTAAASVCNLGLENLGRLADDLLLRADLIEIFRVGWTVLHRKVCMYAASQLENVLADLRCADSDTQTDIEALRLELIRGGRAGMPWRARGAMDVLAILDTPSWAILLGLIDECPVRHAALPETNIPRAKSVDASAFQFISENRHIASIHEFIRELPQLLQP